jgi:hypothetical protein
MKSRLAKILAWEPLAVEKFWFKNKKNNRVE